jgi:hypothetical protein
MAKPAKRRGLPVNPPTNMPLKTTRTKPNGFGIACMVSGAFTGCPDANKLSGCKQLAALK